MSEHGEPQMRRRAPSALIGIVGATALAAVLLLGTLDVGAASGARSGLPQLVEQPGCDDIHVDGDPVEPFGPQGATRQVISLSVPATTLLRVDRGGHVIAAATNTGCAPRPGDDLFYVRPDGSIVAAPTSRMAHRRWFGNFTQPGVYVPQRA